MRGAVNSEIGRSETLLYFNSVNGGEVLRWKQHEGVRGGGGH